MPNYDRANRDPDERVFDGGDDGDDNEGSHLPVVIIITMLVLAAFGGVVWLAYNQGVARGRGDMPVRIATAQPVKTEEGGLKVYQQSAGAEEPDTAAKPAETQASAPATPPAGQPQAATPAPVPMQPSVQSAPKAVTPSYPPPIVAPPPKQQAVTKPEPAAPQVATKPPAQLGVPQAAPPKTAAKPAPEPLKPAALKPMEPAKPAAAVGGYLLQIGAYKSDAEARGAWKTYQGKHSALLSGFSPDVQQTTHPDGSVWYRLRIASFADKTAAMALCDRLKAQGGACFLSK